MELKINKSVYDLVPSLRVGTLVLSGIDNTADVSAFFDAELATLTTSLSAKYDLEELSDQPLIKQWRAIYKSFGEKKARSSIEALIRRIVGGKGLYRINALVDLYNLASLRFELPAGGEDIDTMPDVLELTTATGTEVFKPLGAAEPENPNPGEIIYKTGDIVVCRNFNYRESDITKLTPSTTNAIIVFEDPTGCEETLNAAMDWVAERATTLLGANIDKRTVYSI